MGQDVPDGTGQQDQTADPRPAISRLGVVSPIGSHCFSLSAGWEHRPAGQNETSHLEHWKWKWSWPSTVKTMNTSPLHSQTTNSAWTGPRVDWTEIDIVFTLFLLVIVGRLLHPALPALVDFPP